MAVGQYELLEIIGCDNLLKIQQVYGSSHVYIPVKFNEGCIWRKYLGEELAAKVYGALGGERIWVGKNYVIKKRNSEILRLRIAGYNTQNIGKRYGLTARRIAAICQGDIVPVFGLTMRRRRSIIQAVEVELQGAA